MNFQQLEYILALDRHRHFQRASEACFVTQATLSAMIKRLEDELGVVLFDRSHHPVTPTPVGEAILRQARIILRERDLLKEIVSENQGKVSGELTLAIIPTLAPFLLPSFLPPFLAAYPDVRLTVAEKTTADIIQGLRDNTLQAGILATPLAQDDLAETPLFYEEFYHYGAIQGQPDPEGRISPTQIDPAQLLLVEDGHCLRNQILSLCDLRKAAGQQPVHLDFQSGSVEALLRLSELGLGSTVLPELALSRLSAAQRKRLHRFQAPVPVREISLVAYRHHGRRRLLQALADTIRTHLPPTMTQPAEPQRVLEV